MSARDTSSMRNAAQQHFAAVGMQQTQQNAQETSICRSRNGRQCRSSRRGGSSATGHPAACTCLPCGVRYSTMRSRTTMAGSPGRRRGCRPDVGKTKRRVDRLAQHLQQVADAQTALVSLVDDAMDLAERRHDVEEQHREGQHVAGRELAVDGVINRHGQNEDVEKPFVERSWRSRTATSGTDGESPWRGASRRRGPDA